MAHEFCMNCGFKIQYSLKAPNFCPQCGTALQEGAEASIPSEVEEVVERPAVQWLSKGLEYEISSTQGKVTMGDLIQESKRNPDAPMERFDRPEAKPSNKVGLQESMDSCLPARESRDTGDG